MRLTIVLSALVFQALSISLTANAAPASELVPYYGEQFYDTITTHASEEDIKKALSNVFNQFHVAKEGRLDEIVSSCVGKGRCYNHTPVTYTQARTLILGEFYLQMGPSGYAVMDVYCNHIRGPEDFSSARPGPGKIPNNNVVNVEHTWPQSRFSRRYSDDTQKTDLHHLFPTDSHINAVRGNHPFGEVNQEVMQLDCPESRFGVGSAGSDDVFEPPVNHRGNVARALFYFSVRYELPISEDEEVILRKWHKQDPVDEAEHARNQEIFEIQKTRNPFIDFPDLVDSIQNF